MFPTDFYHGGSNVSSCPIFKLSSEQGFPGFHRSGSSGIRARFSPGKLYLTRPQSGHLDSLGVDNIEFCTNWWLKMIEYRIHPVQTYHSQTTTNCAVFDNIRSSVVCSNNATLFLVFWVWVFLWVVNYHLPPDNPILRESENAQCCVNC